MRSLVALVLAALAHLVFLGVFLVGTWLGLAVPRDAGRAPAPPRPVSMRTLTPEQWAMNRGEALPSPTTQEAARARADAPKREEKKKPEERPEGQVVDVAPGNERQPEQADHLAERSNTVERETRAREQTPFYRNAMPQRSSTNPTTGAGRDEVARAAGNQGIGDDDRPLAEGSEARGAFEVPSAQGRDEVALRLDGSGVAQGDGIANRQESLEVQGNSSRLRIVPGTPGAQGAEASRGRAGEPGAADLLPSMSVLDKLNGAAPNDHLRNVEEGDGTFLNTKEWKFASFFNRVKQSVGQHWDPGRELRLRDPTGNIYGGRDRYTVLNVQLNEQGRVKEIYVEKSCGLEWLDLEAIHSFERAQPFPNPPPGLMTADATVRFSFGFFLEMSSGPRLRLFRQSSP